MLTKAYRRHHHRRRRLSFCFSFRAGFRVHLAYHFPTRQSRFSFVCFFLSVFEHNARKESDERKDRHDYGDD